MDVHVDKARRYDQARRVVYFGSFCRKIRSYGFDFAVFNEDIAYFILLYSRVDYPAAFNE